tara:strand:- start:1346 stop:1930 length:585 start_codon:yes stop_codon:yes gene_type:complete
MRPNKGDIREDGKRYDGSTWRKVGVNHHMNDEGKIFYKRKFRSLNGYLQQGGSVAKIKSKLSNASTIGKVVTLLYDQEKRGYIYAISNPAWKGWLKLGMAIDPNDRCNSYQTSSPLRDYKLVYSKFFKDRRKAEFKMHELARKASKNNNSEWFELSNESAIRIINSIKDDGVSDLSSMISKTINIKENRYAINS